MLGRVTGGPPPVATSTFFVRSRRVEKMLKNVYTGSAARTNTNINLTVQGALGVLNQTQGATLQEEQSELEETERNIEQLLNVLRTDCNSLDEKIEREKHSLKVLHNYKEKVRLERCNFFPVRVQPI